MNTRKATHAGSWYSSNATKLRAELDGWLSDVPDQVAVGHDTEVKLPCSHARVIIAPHAGYRYSGSTAAWAYKALDVREAKRVFLLGPSHHVYLDTCALSQFDAYETPLGNLRLDSDTIDELRQSRRFRSMSPDTDEDEHSLELHLPYIYRMLELVFGTEDKFPTLVPVLVGNTKPSVEREFAAIFADHLADPRNVFVVSSDFAHWGQRFRYTPYLPRLAKPKDIVMLGPRDSKPAEGRPKIWEGILCLDRLIMQAIEAGDHEKYWDALEATQNNVCGRHPIGIMLATVEIAASRAQINSLESHFRFIDYRRSSEVSEVWDSSVSYASAFAVTRTGDMKKEMAAQEGVYRDLNADTLLEDVNGPRPAIRSEDQGASVVPGDEGRPDISQKGN